MDRVFGDTQMLAILDPILSGQLNGRVRSIQNGLQRRKYHKQIQWLDGKRMIASIATQYHRRGFSVIDDTLTAYGTRLKPLLEHGMDFILYVKPGSNVALFYTLDQYMRLGQQQALETVDGLVTWLPLYRTSALNEGYTNLLVDSMEYNVNWKLPGAKLAVDEQLVDHPPCRESRADHACGESAIGNRERNSHALLAQTRRLYLRYSIHAADVERHVPHPFHNSFVSLISLSHLDCSTSHDVQFYHVIFWQAQLLAIEQWTPQGYRSIGTQSSAKEIEISKSLNW